MHRKTNNIYTIMSQADLKREYSYFTEHHDELSKTYLDKFLIIKDESVKGSGDSFEEAYNQAIEMGLEVGTFIIQECAKDLDSLVQTYVSRAVFA